MKQSGALRVENIFAIFQDFGLHVLWSRVTLMFPAYNALFYNLNLRKQQLLTSYLSIGASLLQEICIMACSLYSDYKFFKYVTYQTASRLIK